MEKYKLLITGDDLKHFKAMIAPKNVITACPRGMDNTQWQFWELPNVTVFAILGKNTPMGCRNALLQDHLLKERYINCLTCNQNTCDISTFFKSLAIQLHRDERSEKRTCNVFQLFMKEKGKIESVTFQDVSLNDIQTVQKLLLGINIILNDIDTLTDILWVRWSDGVCRSIPVLLGCYATTVTFTM